MEKYIEFSNISIYDTRIICKESYEAKILEKNNITTLGELFKRFDEDTIDYGPNMVYGNNLLPAQIKGVIRLLKFKYLNENLLIDKVFDEQFNVPSLFAADSSIRARNGRYLDEDKKKIDTSFKPIGLSQKEISVLVYQIAKNEMDSFKLTDTIKLVRNHDFSTKINLDKWTIDEINAFEEKLIWIVKYYNKLNMVQSIPVEQMQTEIKSLEEILKRLMFKKELLQSQLDSVQLQAEEGMFVRRS